MKTKRCVFFRIDYLYKLYCNSIRNGKLCSKLNTIFNNTSPLWEKNEFIRLSNVSTSILSSNVAKEVAKKNLEFLKNMAGPRTSTYDGIENSQSVRLEQKQIVSDTPSTSTQSNNDLNIFENVEEIRIQDTVDDDYVPPKLFCREKQKVSVLPVEKTIPCKILQQGNVVSAAQRNKISPTAFSRLTKEIIVAAGGSTENFTCSPSSAYRAYKSNIATTSQRIKINWIPPERCVLHFDGKLMRGLKGGNKEERLPIIISGPFGSKLLGVPTLGHSLRGIYGETASTAIVQHLQAWECESAVFGMVFDTPNSNIGQISGACISIERKLKRPLLWLACRHHIGETVVRNIWKSCKIESSISPSPVLFQRFSKSWSKLDLRSPVFLPSLDPNCDVVKHLNKFVKTKHIRDDYKELIELSLLYLGGIDQESITFKKPGASHHARWMSKMIYSLKIVMFSNHPNVDVCQEIVNTLIKYCNFCTKVYVPWWVTCQNASMAPRTDLILIGSIIKWKLIDKKLANVALQSIHRHLWYLCDTLVPLALFDELVCDEMKDKIATAILRKKDQHQITRRKGRRFAKIKPTTLEQTEDLSHFVGELSWSFFEYIGCSGQFLTRVSQLSYYI